MEMDAEHAPQWLQQAFEALTARVEAFEQQEAARVNHTPSHTTMDTTPRVVDDVVRRPKPRLPNPDKFDGVDIALYPQFEGLLRAKLDIDGLSIGGEIEKVWYSFGRLTGDGASRIYPWIGYAQKMGTLTVEGLFEQMGIAFRDPRRRQKAMSELSRVKQGSKPLIEFLNEFNRRILEAEGWGWDKEVKKGLLKAALSMRLIQGTVGMKEEESYEAYCSQLRMVSDQLAEIKDLSNQRSAWKSKEAAESAPKTESDAMDWEPSTTVATVRTKQKEPRWGSPEEVERRRHNGLCLRCGKEGHRVKECRVKLKKKNVPIASTTTKQIEELSSDSDDSGKE
jgi:hypothetical protein